MKFFLHNLYIPLVALVDMKKVVWANKSNGQLCVTIPKGSGLNEGDIVSIDKHKVKKIVFTIVAADLFHYGQLQFLEKANLLGEFHICGVLTDSAMREYGKKPVGSFTERKAIVSGLRCVDMVIPQESLNPVETLKKLQEQFNDAEIVFARSSDSKEVPGKEFIKGLKWKVVQIPYYEKLSDKNIQNRVGNAEIQETKKPDLESYLNFREWWERQHEPSIC